MPAGSASPREPHRFQPDLSVAAGQTGSLHLPFWLTTVRTDPSLQEQHLPRFYHKHCSASQELSRNILAAPDQSEHLLPMELIGILGFIAPVLFRPQVSGNKTRQCTETQGRACSKPQTARKQQAPEERGEVCLTICLTLLGRMNRPSKMGCHFQSPFSTGVTYQVLLAGTESDRTNRHTKHSLIQ